MPRVMRAWHMIPERKLAIGAAAKCGSTSIRHDLIGDGGLGCSLDNYRVYIEDIPSSWTKVGVIRHPVDRFYSLYANIQERKRSHNNFYSQFEGRSPWDTFDGILAAGLDYDVHFQPQVSIGLDRANVIVRLENLNDWWSKTFNRDLGIRNTSGGTTKYGREDPRVGHRVIARYAQDMALWESADGTE